MAVTANISSQLSSVRANGLLPYFKQSANRWNISIEVLLAVASRETQMGTNNYYLQNNFTGKDGHGKGIMQIDDRYHNFAKITAPNNDRKMIDYGAQFLADLKQQFGNIKDALSAYNAGPSAVRQAYMRGVDPDIYTTGGDYAKDVLQRAKIIKSQLGLSSKAASALPALLFMLAGSGFLYYQFNQFNATN